MLLKTECNILSKIKRIRADGKERRKKGVNEAKENILTQEQGEDLKVKLMMIDGHKGVFTV